MASAPVARRFAAFQVVDARGAAADLPLGRLDQLEPRNRAEERPRLGPKGLGVRQVAGVVIGHPQRQRMPRRPWLARKELRDVADLGRESEGALGPIGVVIEEVPIVLHRRAAPGRVRRDVVTALELLDRLLGEPPGRVLVAGVEVQGAAAARPLRRGDVVALRSENSGGRLVHLREEDSLDAALEEPDTAAPLAGRGQVLGQLHPAARRNPSSEAGQATQAGSVGKQPSRAEAPLD